MNFDGTRHGSIGRWIGWVLLSALCHGSVFMSVPVPEPAANIAIVTGATRIDARFVRLPAPVDTAPPPLPDKIPPLIASTDGKDLEKFSPLPAGAAPPPLPVKPSQSAEFLPTKPSTSELVENPPPPGEVDPMPVDPVAPAAESHESGATQAERPQAVVSPAPRYPRIAVQRGLEGSVRLSVCLDAEGRPNSVAIQESSGYAFFDREAVETVGTRWRFNTGGERTRPVEVVIVFSLK